MESEMKCTSWANCQFQFVEMRVRNSKLLLYNSHSPASVSVSHKNIYNCDSGAPACDLVKFDDFPYYQVYSSLSYKVRPGHDAIPQPTLTLGSLLTQHEYLATFQLVVVLL